MEFDYIFHHHGSQHVFPVNRLMSPVYSGKTVWNHGDPAKFSESLFPMRIAVYVALLSLMSAGTALAQAKTAPQSPAGKSAPPPGKSTSAKGAKAAPAKVTPPSLAQLAAQGQPDAQLKLGMAYLTGNGMKQDPEQALSWLAQAVGNGEVDGALALARAFDQGDSGLPRDPAMASQWWFKAATMGNADAQTQFVDRFIQGGIRDLMGDTGAQWLEARAAQGDVSARLALGLAYENGLGVARDHAKARDYYQAAAFAGSADAKFRLGRMFLAEPGQWRLVMKERERESENKIRDRRFDSRAAALAAADDAHEPDVLRPGITEGEQWLTDAARNGHADAQYLLGKFKLEGKELPFDLAGAVEWLQRAAWLGQPQALMMLADMAVRGDGFLDKDPMRAWVNYDLAASEGVTGAAELREQIGKTLPPRQLTRARQISQDLRD